MGNKTPAAGLQYKTLQRARRGEEQSTKASTARYCVYRTFYVQLLAWAVLVRYTFGFISELLP